MHISDYLFYLFLLIGTTLSYITKKLTLTGALTGALVGICIYKGAGYTGMGMLALFFVLGSWATGWQSSKKTAIGFAEQDKGRRTAGQVLANSGVAAILGAYAWFTTDYELLIPIMIAGSLASATADTLSSELGTVYGRRFYNVLTFKKDTRGLDGVVSLEGTLIGITGAASISLIYAIGFGWGPPVWWIVVAGFMGNLADSVLGATLERKGIIGNSVVNFLNTLTGALVCLILSNW